jgi:hypothetical protein
MPVNMVYQAPCSACGVTMVTPITRGPVLPAALVLVGAEADLAFHGLFGVLLRLVDLRRSCPCLKAPGIPRPSRGDHGARTGLENLTSR